MLPYCTLHFFHCRLETISAANQRLFHPLSIPTHVSHAPLYMKRLPKTLRGTVRVLDSRNSISKHVAVHTLPSIQQLTEPLLSKTN